MPKTRKKAAKKPAKKAAKRTAKKTVKTVKGKTVSLASKVSNIDKRLGTVESVLGPQFKEFTS